MSRSVNDVHALFDAFENLVNRILLALHPGAGCRCGGDGDAAFALLLHPVSYGGSLVNFANLVDHARVEQDAFGERGLPRINMRGNADIARPLQRERRGREN